MINFLKEHPNYKLIVKNRRPESFIALVIKNEAGLFRNGDRYKFHPDVWSYVEGYVTGNSYPEVFTLARLYESKVFLKFTSGEIELRKEWFKRAL